jgi:predicted lipoprotein with Yx(FWY)xxD motif
MFRTSMSKNPTETNPAECGWLQSRWATGLLLVSVALIAAACSSGASSAGSTSTTSPSASSGTPTTAKSATTSSATLTVTSGTASPVGAVLTGPNGHTLYHLTTEKNGMIECTGSCTQAWPPLTVSSGQTPVLASGITGKISTVNRPDGRVQVTYNGEPLYYYASDTSPGQAQGQGVGGVWFAVPPSSAAASEGSTTTSTTSGGYTY